MFVRKKNWSLCRCVIFIPWLIEQKPLVISHQWRIYTYFVQWSEMKEKSAWHMCTRLLGLMYKPIIEEMRYMMIIYIIRFVGEEKLVLPVGGLVLLRKDERLLNGYISLRRWSHNLWFWFHFKGQTQEFTPGASGMTYQPTNTDIVPYTASQILRNSNLSSLENVFGGSRP